MLLKRPSYETVSIDFVEIVVVNTTNLRRLSRLQQHLINGAHRAGISLEEPQEPETEDVEEDVVMERRWSNYIDTTIIVSTTATSVIAISRVRRLKRFDQSIQGVAANEAEINAANQCGTSSPTTVPV